MNEMAEDLQHIRDRALSVSKVCNRWIAPTCSSNALMMRAGRIHWSLARAISGWAFDLPARGGSSRATALGDFALSVQVNRLTMLHIGQEMRVQWVDDQAGLLLHQLAGARAMCDSAGVDALLQPHQEEIQSLRTALREYCVERRLSQTASRNRWRWSSSHNAVESYT